MGCVIFGFPLKYVLISKLSLFKLYKCQDISIMFSNKTYIDSIYIINVKFEMFLYDFMIF